MRARQVCAGRRRRRGIRRPRARPRASGPGSRREAHWWSAPCECESTSGLVRRIWAVMERVMLREWCTCGRPIDRRPPADNPAMAASAGAANGALDQALRRSTTATGSWPPSAPAARHDHREFVVGRQFGQRRAAAPGEAWRGRFRRAYPACGSGRRAWRSAATSALSPPDCCSIKSWKPPQRDLLRAGHRTVLLRIRSAGLCRNRSRTRA